MKIVVGATAAGHGSGHAMNWLKSAEAMLNGTAHELRFCFAAEVQPNGLEPRLDAVGARVRALGGVVWKFMLDDQSEQIDARTRLGRICQGRNLIIEFALRERADWILHLDADIEPPSDVIERLLELDHPFCGFLVPNYQLGGPVVARYPFPVQRHMNTAGAWFVHRSLFRHFRWLWDLDDGLSEDPATYRAIQARFGLEQYNRRDVVGKHPPLTRFETRPGDKRLLRPELAHHPITAVIPVYFPGAEQVALTDAILARTERESVARVYVLDNGGHPSQEEAAARMFARHEATYGERLQILPAPGLNIHEMWNMGWQRSLADFGDEVLIAFLNNDIDFCPGTLEILARSALQREVWVTYPDPKRTVAQGIRLTGRTRATRGSKRHGGLTGHCFLLKGAIHTRGACAMFDTRFNSWYGDDDLAFRVERHGYQIHCVEGLPCDHINEATMRHRPDLIALRTADRDLFRSLWGDH